jgi:hypothetical protein
MQGSNREMRPGVRELRVATDQRREPTEAARVKAAVRGHQA